MCMVRSNVTLYFGVVSHISVKVEQRIHRIEVFVASTFGGYEKLA